MQCWNLRYGQRLRATSGLPGLLQPSHMVRQALARKANLGVQFTSAAGKPVNYVKGKSRLGGPRSLGNSRCVQRARLLPARCCNGADCSWEYSPSHGEARTVGSGAFLSLLFSCGKTPSKVRARAVDLQPIYIAGVTMTILSPLKICAETV